MSKEFNVTIRSPLAYSTRKVKAPDERMARALALKPESHRFGWEIVMVKEVKQREEA